MPADPHDGHTAFYEAQTRRGHAARGLALAALLVLVPGLLAACGGDDEPDSIAIDAEIEITAERDSATTSTAAESDAMAATDTAAASEQVQLGNRFVWCADIQRMWDELDEAALALAAAEVELDEAWRAQDSATDELDRAEAADAMFAADERFFVALSDYESVAEQAVELLHQARGATGTGTDAIAFRRAWEALTAADPAVLAASEPVPLRPEPSPSGEMMEPTVDSARAGLERTQEALQDERAALEGEMAAWQSELDYELADSFARGGSDEERVAIENEIGARLEDVVRQLQENQQELQENQQQIDQEIHAEQTFEALLWETVAGTPGYTAFKESFRESCA